MVKTFTSSNIAGFLLGLGLASFTPAYGWADQPGRGLTGPFEVELMKLTIDHHFTAMRMTELAARVFSSRSNLTRRIDRLVEEGLVRRGSAATDARGVVVGLTDTGVARLAETAPVHLREVANLFVTPLTDEELAALERVLTKITRDCTFG